LRNRLGNRDDYAASLIISGCSHLVNTLLLFPTNGVIQALKPRNVGCETIMMSVRYAEEEEAKEFFDHCKASSCARLRPSEQQLVDSTHGRLP